MVLMIKSVIQKKLYFIVLGALALLAFMFLWQVNTKQFAINKANKLLKQYKTAQALEIIDKARGKKSGKDSRLDFLYVYALARSHQYEKAEDALENAKPFPKQYKKEIIDFIKLVSSKGETELLLEALPKTKKILLNQKILIGLSKERKNTTEEIKFLEASYKYLNISKHKKKNAGFRKIEDYLLGRYIDVSKILIANKKYKQSLDYLLKAQELPLLDSSQYKDDLYLNLGLSYRGLGQPTRAFDNLKLSANMGNSMAKDIINQINHKYVPRTKKQKKKEESVIQEIYFEITEE